MSLHSHATYPVPETTQRVARAAFPPGNIYMQVADRLGNIYPYDLEPRYRTKREVEWVGYKVHLTETCETDTPDLIVNVETTPATTPDDNKAFHLQECML
jgi:hypothetical protein